MISSLSLSLLLFVQLQLKIDYELVRLQEDVTLAGFTPLKGNMPEPIFCRCDIDIEIAQVKYISRRQWSANTNIFFTERT